MPQGRQHECGNGRWCGIGFFVGQLLNIFSMCARFQLHF